MPDQPQQAFLLHLFHRNLHGRDVIFAVGKLQTNHTFAFMDDRYPPAFYIRQSDLNAVRRITSHLNTTIHPNDNWTTMDSDPAIKITMPRVTQLRQIVDLLKEHGIRTYQGDLKYTRQYLINLQLKSTITIRGQRRSGHSVNFVYQNPTLASGNWIPTLKTLTIDIITNSADASTNTSANTLTNTSIQAIALVTDDLNEVHTTNTTLTNTSTPDPNLHLHHNEAQLLTAVANRVQNINPDIITGWKINDHILKQLYIRAQTLNIPFNIDRTCDGKWAQQDAQWNDSPIPIIYGRQILDCSQLVRVTTLRFDDMRFDTIARSILGNQFSTATQSTSHPLQLYEKYINRARTVHAILKAKDLINLNLRRSILTGLPIDRAWGSVAAFDFLYLTQLNKRRIVAPTLGVDQRHSSGSPGGLILTPAPGLHKHVFVFDFKSLYPSIMRTFNIDPLAYIKAKQQQTLFASSPDSSPPDLITAPNNASFTRDDAILPALLADLFHERDKAKADNNQLASYTYKIVMNSFYGILGTGGCRFGDNNIAGAITTFGHHFLKWTKQLFHQRQHDVLYGDTDSLFVSANISDNTDPKTAHQNAVELCDQANSQLHDYIKSKYQLTSYIQLEFEKYYRYLLLPTSRGDINRARAKGYAGLQIDQLNNEYLDIVGMEAIRRDWTDLAHQLQRQLLTLIFHNAANDELDKCIRQHVHILTTGQIDHMLIYRKQLRKPIDHYHRNIPPHVQAAKQLNNPAGVIHYLITTQGPQPSANTNAPLDYQHYIDKQIKPVAQTIAILRNLDITPALNNEYHLF